MSEENCSKRSDCPYLIIQEGDGKSRKFLLERSQIVIGRDQDCDIVIIDRNASRHHATISIESDDSVFVRDMDSHNGTFVNSEPITYQHLKHLDIIQVGGAILVFNAPNDLDSENQGTRLGNISKDELNFDNLRQVVRQLEENITKVFKGNPIVVRNLIVCLLADGHILFEDVPGVGKSLLAQTLAKSIQGQYRRIQFTPDMLPSDITGTNIYDESSGSFRFLPGPIFGNVILADEINRTTPRTQSSLLECMSESSVTVDGKSHVLPKPFFVIATQNPEDYHGTYPLPEPQLDRFLMCLHIGYPSPQAELEILDTQITSHPLNSISYVIRSNNVVYCQAMVRNVKVSPEIKKYIVEIVNATRSHEALINGCSPRASLAIMRSCQGLAAYNGRDYVTPHDVREMLKIVVAHRLRLKLRYRSQWHDVDHVLDSILESVNLPNEDKV